MAKKFLPFVTENTSPIEMYKALVHNGNGCHYRIVGAVFYVVMTEGIDDVRERVGGDVTYRPSKEIYAGILHNYNQASDIQADHLKEFIGICSFLTDDDIADWPKALRALTKTQAHTFLYVMAVCRTSQEITKLRVDRLIATAYFDGYLENMKTYLLFSDTGVPVRFDGPVDLRYYILCQVLLRNGYNNNAPVRPYFEVLEEKGTADVPC